MPTRRSLPSFYRVFQRRRAPGLCCAVRQDMLIPDFVRADGWDFGADVHEGGACRSDSSRPRRARATAAFGCYLFHHPSETLAPKHSRRWMRELPEPQLCVTTIPLPV
ncbi:hypothetical protein ACU4GR_02530 [Methylobacterium oryzae CBMB20]